MSCRPRPLCPRMNRLGCSLPWTMCPHTIHKWSGRGSFNFYMTNNFQTTLWAECGWVGLKLCRDRPAGLTQGTHHPRDETSRTFRLEAEFLDEIQTKVLRMFLLAVHSDLSKFALRFLFLQTHATSHSFYSSVTVHCKGKRRKTL
jgi:hypothetical protein